LKCYNDIAPTELTGNFSSDFIGSKKKFLAKDAESAKEEKEEYRT
jgi:hypothetical protein